jgi:ATP-dependent DNA helicase RecG
LRRPHASIPRNPLIAEPLFLAHYAEKAGTGTVDMIALCREGGLPEPEFRQDGGQFVMTLWRDWLTDSVIPSLNLNERQREVLNFLKINRRISNADYQKLTGAIRKTASRDLEDLTRRKVLQKVGKTGRGTYYVLAPKGDIKETKGTSHAALETGHKQDKRDIPRKLGNRTGKPARRLTPGERATNAPTRQQNRKAAKRK